MLGARLAIAGFHEGLAGQVSSWFGLALKGRRLVCFLHPESYLPKIPKEAAENRASARFVFPVGDRYRGLPIVYGADWAAQLRKANVKEIICALPDPEDRASFYYTAQLSGFMMPPVIHPSAVILQGARIAAGSIIEPLSYVGLDADLGIGCQVHAGAQINHNSVLGDFVTLNPKVVIAGNVKVGEKSTINMGAMISNGVFLGDRTVVGASAFVSSSFPEPGNRLFGIPARTALK